MKKSIFLTLLVFGLAYVSGNAQEEAPNTAVDTISEVFTVYGNCGMCERTIEGLLKDVQGVFKADWDRETDQMKVSFNPQEIALDAIKQKIADVGYDSDTHRAKDEVYNSLPECCQYDRPEN
jgi:copper chaperone CopZ